MVKGKNQSKQDAYTTNLLISILMRFPEVMAVNLNRRSELAKFTFVLMGKIDNEKFRSFKQMLADSFDAFTELTGEDIRFAEKLRRQGNINLMEISCSTSFLSLESIQLMAGIVDRVFSRQLMRDEEAPDAVHEDELLRQEEIIDYLLNHSTGTKQENLIAFREEGKVFVYDK